MIWINSNQNNSKNSQSNHTLKPHGHLIITYLHCLLKIFAIANLLVYINLACFQYTFVFHNTLIHIYDIITVGSGSHHFNIPLYTYILHTKNTYQHTNKTNTYTDLHSYFITFPIYKNLIIYCKKFWCRSIDIIEMFEITTLKTESVSFTDHDYG